MQLIFCPQIIFELNKGHKVYKKNRWINYFLLCLCGKMKYFAVYNFLFVLFHSPQSLPYRLIAVTLSLPETSQASTVQGTQQPTRQVLTFWREPCPSQTINSFYADERAKVTCVVEIFIGCKIYVHEYYNNIKIGLSACYFDDWTLFLALCSLFVMETNNFYQLLAASWGQLEFIVALVMWEGVRRSKRKPVILVFTT